MKFPDEDEIEILVRTRGEDEDEVFVRGHNYGHGKEDVVSLCSPPLKHA